MTMRKLAEGHRQVVEDLRKLAARAKLIARSAPDPVPIKDPRPEGKVLQ